MTHIQFEFNIYRKVSEAYFNQYIHGLCHPDRIMEEHDFVYMCEGEWEIYLDGHPFLLKKDYVLILPAKIHHYGKSKCTDRTKIIYIHVSAGVDAFWPKGINCVPDKTYIPLFPLIDCRNTEKVKNLFEKIVTEYASDHLYRESGISSLFQMLLIELFAVQNKKTEKYEDELVETAIQLMRDNPGHFHSMQDFSKSMYVSSKTFINHFKKNTGTTPHKFEWNMKLNSAASFMREYPNVRLYEVAKKFGFYDEFHFSREFSKKFLISPTEYRKRNAKMEGKGC